MIIPVVFATDDNYVLPLSVAIQSLKNHKKKHVEIEIYIFYEKLKEENIELLKSLESKWCNVNFVNVAQYFKDGELYSVGYFSVAMYYRIVAPLILAKYKKIIYLDCDIILKNCISELYNVNLTDHTIAAVHDVFFSKETYVNSGVIIFNVEKYLEKNSFYKCLEIIKSNKDLKHPDQDVINEVCEGAIHYLPYTYNYMSYTATDIYYMRLAGINKISNMKLLHFTSPYKPWLYKNFPFSNLWWKETKNLPKEIRKVINAKYKRNLKNDKFDNGAFKFMFGSKIYQFFVKLKIKMIKNKKEYKKTRRK